MFSDLLTVSDFRNIDSIDFKTKIARIESGNTTAEEERIRKLLRDIQIREVTLAAKPNELNNAFLVFYAVTKNNREIYLGDGFSLNIARNPRIIEVKSIIKDLSTKNDIEKNFIPKLIQDTASLSLIESLNRLKEYERKILDENSLIDFLQLLGGNRINDEWVRDFIG